MSIATMEKEIVGVSVNWIKPGDNNVHLMNIVVHSFAFPEAWVDTSRLDHRLLV